MGDHIDRRVGQVHGEHKVQVLEKVLWDPVQPLVCLVLPAFFFSMILISFPSRSIGSRPCATRVVSTWPSPMISHFTYCCQPMKIFVVVYSEEVVAGSSSRDDVHQMGAVFDSSRPLKSGNEALSKNIEYPPPPLLWLWDLCSRFQILYNLRI